jgi:hypothetical protein
LTDYAAFQTRYAIRLPDGNLAMAPHDAPWMWDNRDTAQRAIGYFRQSAKKIGVNDWEGEIVRQLCTPWIGDDDNAVHLMQELTDWLARETGGRE